MNEFEIEFQIIYEYHPDSKEHKVHENTIFRNSKQIIWP